MRRKQTQEPGLFDDTGRVFSVSELTVCLKSLLDHHFPSVWVSGEISNFKEHSSGHLYFSLKDEGAQISVVMFRPYASRLRFSPADGQKILVCGSVTVYEKRGNYQLMAQTLEVRGLGALQLALEQLKQRLSAEGLFDPARKRPLPPFPRRVGLVTSPTGAAVRDLITVLGRRFPGLHILLYPVLVQGPGAAAEIARAVDDFSSCPEIAVDVLIVGRGGGSAEDLGPFNEEIVARSLARSKIPVISAVGHETDWTICDLVADLRAPTPSAAAEMAVRDKGEVREQVQSLRLRLGAAVRAQVQSLRLRLGRCLTHYALREPAHLVRQLQLRVDDLSERLELLFRSALSDRRRKLQFLLGRLEALSPLGVLARGYSITADAATGRVLGDASALEVGQEIDTVFSRGRVRSRVIRRLPDDGKEIESK